MPATIESIARSIASQSPAREPVLVAVEGFGGSGKSTFADKLKSLLGNAYVVNIDDFIVKEHLAERSWDKGTFDRARLEKQVLVPATTGHDIAYQQLIWSTNTLSDLVPVPPVSFLIVEGISTYHPDIAHYYDFKIWVDTPIKIAKERGHARETNNENAAFWDLWAANDLAYQQKYHPEQAADFVYENGDAETVT
jgi:uridine kinase